jgi:nucleotide-binding universal stress UspA family protein
MKSILVPTDFTANSSHAVTVAASIAKKTGARLLLQHNVDDWAERTIMRRDTEMGDSSLVVETVESANKLRKEISSEWLRHLNVKDIVTHGITSEKILDETIQESADLLVLGSHGNESGDRVFIGSNIQKVLRGAPCPVMTINREPQELYWQKVVVPLSFDEDVSQPFRIITTLASELGSEIHLLFVNTPDGHKNDKQVRAGMYGIIHAFPNIKFETAIYSHKEIEVGILEYSHDINADWIAMVTHNRKHKAKYLIGVAETIAFKSDIPVLTVQINQL